MERQRVKRLLDEVNLVEGEHYIQRKPQSMVCFSLEDLKKEHDANVRSMAALNYRIRRINKIQKQREEDFSRAVQERIDDAIEEKRRQDAFKVLDGGASLGEVHGENSQPLKRQQLAMFRVKKKVEDNEMLNLLANSEEAGTLKKRMRQANQEDKAKAARMENHVSFQKRLWLHEAEKIHEYTKTVKAGKLSVDFD